MNLWLPVHPVTIKLDNQKDLLYSTWNPAQCYVEPGWEGSLGENGYVYMYG